MDRIRYVATNDSLNFARKIGDALGEDFDRAGVEVQARHLQTVFFNEAMQVLGADYRHFKLADFSRGTIDAFASRTRDGRPFLHIDQQFYFCIFDICVLWAVAALCGVEAHEETEFDDVFVQLLDQLSQDADYEELRKDAVPWIEKLGANLTVAHALATGCYLTIVCHEIAHHRLNHISAPQRRKRELDADAMGFDLLQKIYATPTNLSAIPYQPYAAAAPWAFLRILDAAERRQVVREGPSYRRLSKTHPLAIERLGALEDRLDALASQSTHAHNFMEGFGGALDGALNALGLLDIK